MPAAMFMCSGASISVYSETFKFEQRFKLFKFPKYKYLAWDYFFEVKNKNAFG